MNRIREAWVEGRTAFGLWSVMPGSFGVEVLAAAGPDYVCVDLQHGLAGHDSMVPMLAAVGAAGAAPIARVLANDAAGITKVLDAGTLGVIVPLVESAEEAARAVAACRYPPRGNRSYGPVRASVMLGSKEPEELDRDVLCFVMVETREGLENIEEIAATPGLDGIYIGPSDLALSLGLPPTLEIEHPEHAAAVERIKKACRGAGIAAGIHSGSGEWARRHAEAGFDMVTVATDATLLGRAASRELSEARGEKRTTR
ncbi:MAG: aldolase/citrate lyase family protein [Actinomycetota bacterium]